MAELIGIPDEMKEKVVEWVQRQESLICPMAIAFRMAEPANQVPQLTCLKERCRFYVPGIRQKVVDPKITVVSNKPPEGELVWQCEIDLISSEVSSLRQMMIQFLGGLRTAPVRPR